MKCQSCGMPIESGAYCPYCVDENGNLQTLEERVKRMSLFLKQRNPKLSDEEAVNEAKQQMKKMPAWKGKL
ncbi:MAG: hypothetical protein HQK49_08155 [Oligoflexia bacterium]|nr:hypothetical protein [Oligoflexia bacterium]